jgi:HK97 family phage prohead protease
MKEIRACNKEI